METRSALIVQTPKEETGCAFLFSFGGEHLCVWLICWNDYLGNNFDQRDSCLDWVERISKNSNCHGRRLEPASTPTSEHLSREVHVLGVRIFEVHFWRSDGPSKRNWDVFFSTFAGWEKEDDILIYLKRLCWLCEFSQDSQKKYKRVSVTISKFRKDSKTLENPMFCQQAPFS